MKQKWDGKVFKQLQLEGGSGRVKGIALEMVFAECKRKSNYLKSN